MKWPILSLLSILLLLRLAPANAAWFGPDDYNECILGSMKGVTSDVAAQLIRRSCREKFPENEKSANSANLTQHEREQITGRAGYRDTGKFLGRLYNGNSHLTVTEITVAVTTTLDGKELTRNYTANVMIPPQATADITLDVLPGDKGAKYSWAIVNAKGY